MTSSETDNTVLPDKADPKSAGRFSRGELLAGRFVVVRYIDRGGMGEVYEVEDRFLQKVHVALKVIVPEIAGDTGSAHHFEQEVLLARKVVHPNLCPIYDIARCDDPAPPFLFLTMKLLIGETLSARLKREEPIAREDAITIFRQLVAGLAAIHAAGIVHRDIKPNNVMLDSSGPELCVSIMDFGLARLHETESTIATQSLMAGTPGYMPPEILSSGPSQAADIFALGVLLHQVLTGERPRVGALNHSVEPTAALDKTDVPLVFIQAVKGFLSNDPKVRCEAFEHIKSTLGSGSSAGHWTAPPAPAVRKRPLTRRQFAYGSAVAACAAAGGIAWKWDRLEDLMHPLPAKRFVAVLGWPTPADDRLKNTISSVVDAIGSELARAEAFDHDLLIIPRSIGSNVTSLSQLNKVREAVGANLVLAASGSIMSTGFHLLFRLFDPNTGKTLRQKALIVPSEDQLQVPQLAVRTAAGVLNISRYKPDDQRSKVGTNNPEAFDAFREGESLRAQDNDEGLKPAIDKYKLAIEIDPHYANAQSQLAWAYLRLYGIVGDPAALRLAGLNFHSAIQSNPNLSDAHLGLASFYKQTGDDDGEWRETSLALSLDPRNPHALTYQADFYAADNRWEEAEATFKRVLNLRPNYWLAHNEFGAVLEDEGKYPEALTEFRLASLAAPKNAFALKSVGSACLKLGKMTEAMEKLNTSYTMNPSDVTAVLLAEAYRLQQKYPEAIDYALKAKDKKKTEPGHWLELGDVYTSAGRYRAEANNAYGEAAAAQEDELRTSPSEGPFWMVLALCRAKTSQLETALTLIAKAESLHADDMGSQLLKVRILELAGRRADALATITRCLSRGPTLFQFNSMPDLEKLRASPEFKSIVASTASANQAIT
jgi:eukaryotic-like serine/threonine-protein kinase